jgi:hypothetical protein
MPRLVLQELKQLYDGTRGWPQWSRHLILGALIAFQEWYLPKKIKAEVDRAVEEVEKTLPPSQVSPPVYSESGSGFFDEMRLRAPWVPLQDPSDSP